MPDVRGDGTDSGETTAPAKPSVAEAATTKAPARRPPTTRRRTSPTVASPLTAPAPAPETPAVQLGDDAATDVPDEAKVPDLPDEAKMPDAAKVRDVPDAADAPTAPLADEVEPSTAPEEFAGDDSDSLSAPDPARSSPPTTTSNSGRSAAKASVAKLSGAWHSVRSAVESRRDSSSRDASRAPAATTPAPTTSAERDAEHSSDKPVVLSIQGLVKRYGSTVAVENVDLEIRAGSFYGIVGPNGAGKTTTLSMATGLLRPDAGRVEILGTDVWSTSDAGRAKRSLGVLPDRLRLFDRLTGAQFLYYAAVLRGLDAATARKRSADLADAFGLHDALGRLVSDYSVGMTKKVALAAAIIHSPRLLVLDEPFESVDPVSAATVTEILQRYVRGGGTVLLSSHSMDLVERICDSVAVIVDGHVLAQGTVDEVRDGRSLQERFIELAGGGAATEGMEWLHTFSD